MKIGNDYSGLLNNFTENYAKIAKMLLNAKADTGDFPENDVTSSEYDTLLDKFARHRMEADSKTAIKEQLFKFINTEENRDNHLCELILRRVEDSYKLKLTHYTGSFDYAGFQNIWKFAKTEEKLAKQVFDTVVFTINGIKEKHNRGMKHTTTILPMIREAVKTIAESHQKRKNILSLDEKDIQRGESDWEQTLYGNKYPPLQEETRQEMFHGNHEKANIRRTMYTGRNTKTTRII